MKLSSTKAPNICYKMMGRMVQKSLACTTLPRGPYETSFDTEDDLAKVPPYNGNDPPPAPGSLKVLLFPLLLNEVQNKGYKRGTAFPLSSAPVVQSYWAWNLDASRQKLTPHCLAGIFDSQLPSPKLSLKMPPKLPLPHKRGPFFSSFKIAPAVRVVARQLSG